LTPTTFLPLAYLPGASGSAAVWRPIASRLAARRSPIFCDYPGLGSDAASDDISSIDELTQRVLAELPPCCDLAALSMGAALALRIALDHPDRIRRLVLVAAAGGVDVLALGGVDWREAFERRRPDAPRWLVEDQADFSARLGLISAPTLLIFGDQDLIAPAAVGHHLSARLPNAKLEIIGGATHDIEEEYPDLLASLIEAHLRGAP
jgi:pimeloyl-ACP methyl ester carboxylesterase